MTESTLRANNPWTQLPEFSTHGVSPGAVTYVLPDDAPIIHEYNLHHRSPDTQINLDLPPDAFVGSPFTARIALLTKRPSYNPANINHVRQIQGYGNARSQNLLFGNNDYPFYFLNPAFSESGGAQWWRPALRHIVDECTNLIGYNAEQVVAQRIVTIPYLPYHTTNYSGGIDTLPSQQYSRELVRHLIINDIPIVIMYFADSWLRAIPELRGIAMSTNSTSKFITRGNLPAGAFDILTRAIIA